MASQIARPVTDSFFKESRTFSKRFPNGMPIGPRTIRRHAENKKLNKLGIRFCEIKIPGICAGNRMLTWAHATKSRFLITSEDWQRAAKCCLPCHQYIEALPHKEMGRVVNQAIAKRRQK